MKVKIAIIYSMLQLSVSIILLSAQENLSNTAWELVVRNGNTGTWKFRPMLCEAYDTSSNVKLQFSDDVSYSFICQIGDSCKIDISGTYTIEGCMIDFNDIERDFYGCQDDDHFRFGVKSFKIVDGDLYLTRYTAWYDMGLDHSGDTIVMTKEHIGSIQENDNGLHYVTDANVIPLNDGVYKADFSATTTFIFRVKNGLIDGLVSGYQEDYNYEYKYEDGMIQSEKVSKDGDLIYSKFIKYNVESEGADYIISKNIVSVDYSKNSVDSIIVTYKNSTPVRKERYEDHQLTSQRDFEQNNLKIYNKGVLEYYWDPHIEIQFDQMGNEKEKKIYKDGGYEIFRYETLTEKMSLEDGWVMKKYYDEQGNIIKKVEEKVSHSPIGSEATEDMMEDDLKSGIFNTLINRIK